MKARCAHGAPWWREDCPWCGVKWEALPPPRIVTDRPWWGWTDGFRYLCGPCGAVLQPDFSHHCPGAPP
jgi:hypothetical protein